MSVSCVNTKVIQRDLARSTDFLKVIGEENRLKILYMLKDGEKCVCEIWQCLDLPQNLVSHHLKVLKEHGLIQSRKEGQKIYYVIAKDEIMRRITALMHIVQ